ncbi:dispanin subfamily A member 2b-like [Chelmon rostratus]|uniref:dispanin subfamily A member 2b-like n=1 Tax=Chelmon rostratus TaxID=109905 RepID=UPI001BE4F216|nr:dispanin subfamily A member 2b-like [Chelmon rostratus]
MNPVGHPAEAVPLQGRSDGLPGQPGAATVVQYTAVDITSEPPKDHIAWSQCCFSYSNPCCLGLAALIFSVKSRNRRVAGDLEGARHYGSISRCLNILSSVLTVIMVLIFIIIMTS